MPTKKSIVHLKNGAIRNLSQILGDFAVRRILFVVDEVAYTSCGARDFVEECLDGYEVCRFADFETNPKLQDVERGIFRARAFSPDLVIALGGGTAMDMGKLIGLLSRQPAPARDIVIGEAYIACEATPIIAIATTAGTGSEATHFAVVYVDGEKYSLAHPSLLPDYAIIDPNLTKSNPPRLAVASGLDAFCQGIESIWAVNATEESLCYATEAVEYAWRFLNQSVFSPTSEAQLRMCQASHLAGKAINISKTTAPHALSYVLTSQFHIPHGIAVAMTLSAILGFNASVTLADCVDPRGPKEVTRRIAMITELLGASSVREAQEKLKRFISDLGCPCSLVAAGITDEQDLLRIVRSVNSDRMSNNPRKISETDLLQLLREQ